MTPILINGEESDGRIPVTDSSVLRGDGCFEVLKSYRGEPFALEEHLSRLEASANSLGIPLPDRSLISDWVVTTATQVGDGAVRIVVTRGSNVPGVTGVPLVIVFGHPWASPVEPVSLYPVVAPWHAAGVDWDLAGAKVTSYAPNLAASRRAFVNGYDDALLLTVDRLILEGPTFSVGWVVDDVLETPSLELGILDSITRRLVLEDAVAAGIQLVEGRWDFDRLADADEVLAMSTIREVQPVARIGDLDWPVGPVTKTLAAMFGERTG